MKKNMKEVAVVTGASGRLSPERVLVNREGDLTPTMRITG
jgi:hypothetical protein